MTAIVMILTDRDEDRFFIHRLSQVVLIVNKKYLLIEAGSEKRFYPN